MSADNGIYILHCKDGYRVTEAQAIDNIRHNSGTEEFNARQLYLYFWESKLYKIKEEALSKASKIYDDILNSICPIIEYGISILGTGYFEFPTEEPPCCKNPHVNVNNEFGKICDNCGEWL